MNTGYKFTFDLNAPLNFQENSSNATDEENIIPTGTCDTAVLVKNARPNGFGFDFDLNNSPNVELNELPPSETPAPLQGGEISSTRIKTKHLSNEVRRAIYLALSKQSLSGTLKQGTTKIVANEFSVSMRTVQRIWQRAKETSAKGMVDVSHLKKNCGRKKKQVDPKNIAGQPSAPATI